MEHFLITRFNIATNWTLDKAKRPTHTRQWLEQRFSLFEEYCLPSVMAQTCTDFKWLCLFDADTPLEYIDRIEEYGKKCKNFIPCFLSETEARDFIHSLQGIIRSLLPVNADIVITSRLDNDDAIHRDMMRLVRTHAETVGPHDRIISFLYGYQYIIELNLLVRVKYRNNHYLSRIEPASSFHTVMDFSHTKASKSGNVDILGEEKKPFWIEVVHDSNVINTLITSSSSRPVLRRSDLSAFGIEKNFQPFQSFIGFCKGYIPKYISRKLKTEKKNR